MQLVLLEPKKQQLYLRLGITLCVICQILMIFINRAARNIYIEIAGLPLSYITVSGMLMSVMLFTCIMLVFIDWRRGYRAASVFQLLMLVSSSMQVLVVGNTGALPGMLSAVLAQVALRMISNQVQRSEQLTLTSYITNAPNMRGMVYELDKLFFAGTKGWFLNIHLERFRAINDGMGYAYGNEALRQVDARLKAILPEKGLLANMTGAELGVILPFETDPEEWAAMAMKLLEEKLVLNVDGNQQEAHISAFAGIAGFPADADCTLEVIKCAGTAMSYAREKQHSKFIRFSQTIAQTIYRREELADLIKQALHNDWFFMVYQPQFEIAKHRLRGFEALLRMRLPDGTMVSPGEFIPVAETSQLIFDIEDFTLRRSMTQFRNASKLRDFILSVNVSAKSMSNPQFPARIGKILQEMDFPANRLELEITEYSFAESQEQTISNIRALDELGVKVALDDFGTGYTSLEQLLRLPVSLLKIDKSLIDNICDSRQNLDFVKAIIYMGHLMECEVISEGVEDTGQLELLHEQECDFVQGYVWGKPMEFEKAEALLDVKICA